MSLSILDVTIRDGSYAIGYQYTPNRIFDIIQSLDEAGIDFAEVNHGCGLGAGRMPGLKAAASDLEYVRAAKKAAKSIKIGVNRRARKPLQNAAISMKSSMKSTSYDLLQTVMIPSSSNQTSNTLAKGANDLPIFFQLMRSSRLPTGAIIESAKKVEQMGVDTLYIVDTTGHFSPDGIGELISDLKTQIGIAIGFHGHNNLDLGRRKLSCSDQSRSHFRRCQLKGNGPQRW